MDKKGTKCRSRRTGKDRTRGLTKRNYMPKNRKPKNGNVKISRDIIYGSYEETKCRAK